MRRPSLYIKKKLFRQKLEKWRVMAAFSSRSLSELPRFYSPGLGRFCPAVKGRGQSPAPRLGCLAAASGLGMHG